MPSKMTARFKTITISAEDEAGQPVELFRATAHLLTVAERMQVAELIEAQVSETEELRKAIESGEANKAAVMKSGLAPLMSMVEIMTDATREKLEDLIQEDLVEVFQQAQAFSLGHSKQQGQEAGESPKARQAQA